MLIVLLVLTYAEKDEEFKKRLLGVLSFYRENRELLTALMQKREPSPAPAEPTASGGENERTTKNSPPEGGENLHVLEDFLKRV